DLVRGAGERDSLDLAGASARGEDADHGQPLFVDLQRTPHRGLEAEQLAAHAVADDAHLREGLFVARPEETFAQVCVIGKVSSSLDPKNRPSRTGSLTSAG